MISEILRIALQLKGEELAWVGGLIFKLWAAMDLPASLWWWVLPGAVAWVLIVAFIIFACEPEKKEHRLGFRTRLIGTTVTLFIGWAYWNILAASMRYFEYCSSPRMGALYNMALGAVADFLIVICFLLSAVFIGGLFGWLDY